MNWYHFIFKFVFVLFVLFLFAFSYLYPFLSFNSIFFISNYSKSRSPSGQGQVLDTVNNYLKRTRKNTADWLIHSFFQSSLCTYLVYRSCQCQKHRARESRNICISMQTYPASIQRKQRGLQVFKITTFISDG